MSKLFSAIAHEPFNVDKTYLVLIFMHFVKSGNFPLDNTALELFLDVLDGFSRKSFIIAL